MMNKIIENKVLKTGLIDWKSCKWLQIKNFKTLTKDEFFRLCASVKKNHVIDALKVWESPGGELYWLDGHHRQKVFEELIKQGFNIPDKLTANFIECKDKKQAVKYCILYGSLYAKVTEEGLHEMIEMNQLDFEDLKSEIDIPGIDVDYFEACYYKDNNGDDIDIDEFMSNPNKTTDVKENLNSAIIKITLPIEEYKEILELTKKYETTIEDVFYTGVQFLRDRSENEGNL